MNINLGNLDAKRIIGVATALGMGAMTVLSTLTDQKRAIEFEELKKTVSELSKNK